MRGLATGAAAKPVWSAHAVLPLDCCLSRRYFMEINNALAIDARTKGNLSRFINHSCDPNCELQKWCVPPPQWAPGSNGSRSRVYSLRLEPGTWLGTPVLACSRSKTSPRARNSPTTIRYVVVCPCLLAYRTAPVVLTLHPPTLLRVQFNTKEELRCLCGTAKCRGFLGVDVAADKLAEAQAAAGGAGAGGRGKKRGRPVPAAEMSKKARRRLLKKSKSMVRVGAAVVVVVVGATWQCGGRLTVPTCHGCPSCGGVRAASSRGEGY